VGTNTEIQSGYGKLKHRGKYKARGTGLRMASQCRDRSTEKTRRSTSYGTTEKVPFNKVDNAAQEMALKDIQQPRPAQHTTTSHPLPRLTYLHHLRDGRLVRAQQPHGLLDQLRAVKRITGRALLAVAAGEAQLLHLGVSGGGAADAAEAGIMAGCTASGSCAKSRRYLAKVITQEDSKLEQALCGAARVWSV
jgi:hypothetical protein